MKKGGYFYNLTKGFLSFEEVIKEIISWMGEKPNFKYEVVVGCDSSSLQEPSFPIVVVVWRKGQGGRFFVKKVKYIRKFSNWKERILQEVYLSCDLAISLKSRLKEEIEKLKLALDFEFKYIHADVGEYGATKDMVKEVINLIKGSGFEPKIKPEAFVASAVADRYT